MANSSPDTIFDHRPRDWKELQNMVAQFFSEIGCDVAVGMRRELVRGDKEIDVDVTDPSTAPPSLYLCECKFWSKPIPLEVIHSFRTVVADCGANRGFIISSLGFQSGAHEAARKTNLALVTFDELQKLFFPRWRVAMGERYMPYADQLFPYWDPSGGRRPTFQWTDQHREQHRRLVEAYSPLVDLGPVLKDYGFAWRLPITIPVVDDSGRVTGKILLNSYRSVYDFIEANKEVALRRFQALHGE